MTTQRKPDVSDDIERTQEFVLELARNLAPSASPALRSVTFVLPPTPTLNQLRGMIEVEYRRFRMATAWSLRAALNGAGYFSQPPMRRAAVSISRYSVQAVDPDNASGGLKPVLDCLVMPSLSHPNGLGVILDDNPRCLVLTVATHVVAQRQEQRTVVVIQELPELPPEEKPERVKRVKRTFGKPNVFKRSAASRKGAATRGKIAAWNASNARRLGIG